MNTKNFFLFLLLTTSTINLYSTSSSITTYELNVGLNNTPLKPTEKPNPNKKAEWRAFCKAYFVSIATGGFIGNVTGYLKRHIEERLELSFPITLISLILEARLRHEMINIVQKDFDQYHIKHSKDFMHMFSTLISWLTYLSKA